MSYTPDARVEVRHDRNDAAERLAEMIGRTGGLFVLTGAGCSTASGIPDYRDAEGRWKGGQPTMFQDFRRDADARARYWARSFVGWPRVADAEPNRAHRSLRQMERAGLVHQLVTQNVDGLHHRAGSRRVIELHGSLSRVDCLDCGFRMARREMQDRLADANPDFASRSDLPAPDGDAAIAEGLEKGFVVPGCPECGGTLKPAVVFFGENVPRPRVERAFMKLRQAGAVLAAGSSLTVFSGFRFCREAAARGIPIALVNRGRTRADELASVKVDGDVGTVLDAVAREFSGRSP